MKQEWTKVRPILPESKYLVKGITTNSCCREYWLEDLEKHTTRIYKDKTAKLKYRSVIVGTKLKIELNSVFKITRITILSQPYNLPKNKGH